MSKVKVSEEAVKKLQAERHRIRESLAIGIRAFTHSPDKLVAVKCGDLDKMLDWLNEYIDREQHNGLITK